MIWLCEVPPNQTLLSREWESLTGDSFVVDVRPLSDPLEGFIEVCKYALKFSDLSLVDNYHAFEIMSGMRLIDAHGVLRGVDIPDSLYLTIFWIMSRFWSFSTGISLDLTE